MEKMDEHGGLVTFPHFPHLRVRTLLAYFGGSLRGSKVWPGGLLRCNPQWPKCTHCMPGNTPIIAQAAIKLPTEDDKVYMYLHTKHKMNYLFFSLVWQLLKAWVQSIHHHPALHCRSVHVFHRWPLLWYSLARPARRAIAWGRRCEHPSSRLFPRPIWHSGTGTGQAAMLWCNVSIDRWLAAASFRRLPTGVAK